MPASFKPRICPVPWMGFIRFLRHVALCSGKEPRSFLLALAHVGTSRHLRLSWPPTCQTEYWGFAALRSEPPQVSTVLRATLDLSDSLSLSLYIYTYIYIIYIYTYVPVPICFYHFYCHDLHKQQLWLFHAVPMHPYTTEDSSVGPWQWWAP